MRKVVGHKLALKRVEAGTYLLCGRNNEGDKIVMMVTKVGLRCWENTYRDDPATVLATCKLIIDEHAVCEAPTLTELLEDVATATWSTLLDLDDGEWPMTGVS